MGSADITMTAKCPEPPRSDFALYLDVKRGEGPASREFSATHQFIQACERLDREPVGSIDTNIETVMVLEDIEASSLKTCLRNVLQAIDRGKYLILKWIEEDGAAHDLPTLGREIQKLAAETDVRHIPDYAL